MESYEKRMLRDALKYEIQEGSCPIRKDSCPFIESQEDLCEACAKYRAKLKVVETRRSQHG